MDKIKILWADDEIDLLRPHIIFLNEKGYQVETANNGTDALDIISKNHVDIVFLDENMPGLSGLETLLKIKNIKPDVPVVMITKNEAEEIMEEAIGSKIADYLIKPVNPNQILLSIKKNLDHRRLISEKTNQNYQQEFRQIGMRLGDRLNWEEWVEVYKKIVYWELELEGSNDKGMYDVLKMQKAEANLQFGKFIESNYLSWLKDAEKAPLLSHHLLRKKLFPVVDSSDVPVFFILIDNLRFDQWKVIKPLLSDLFLIAEEDTFCSILPTATQYARNAIFAGMMPSDIEKRFPNKWVNDDEEGGKNNFESDFLADHLSRVQKNYKFSYTKVTNIEGGKQLVDQISNLYQNKLNVIVYNFVDMLSHARTEMQVIRELADDEKAYRSLTKSWFANSPLFDALKKISEKP